MDPISKDALTETRNVLKDLSGFLRAVQTSTNGAPEPVLRATANKLCDLADEIEALAAAQMPKSRNSMVVEMKLGNVRTLVGKIA